MASRKKKNQGQHNGAYQAPEITPTEPQADPWADEAKSLMAELDALDGDSDASLGAPEISEEKATALLAELDEIMENDGGSSSEEAEASDDAKVEFFTHSVPGADDDSEAGTSPVPLAEEEIPAEPNDDDDSLRNAPPESSGLANDRRGFTNGSGRGMTNGMGRSNGFTNGSGRGLTNGGGSGRTNGMVNGRGRTNGMTNGRGRTNGMVNGRGRTNGMTNGRGRTNGMVNGKGRTNGMTNGRGRTNGMVNGNGRTNGMTNGRGRTNGMVNGLHDGRTNGFINGTAGLTNGIGGRFHPGGSRSPSSKSRRYLILIALAVCALFLLPVLYVLIVPAPAEAKTIDVDGEFDDWNKQVVYDESTSIAEPALDIVDFAVATDPETVYGYVRTRGDVVSRQVIDRFYLFIDSDGNSATGYEMEGIGAEYVVEAYGYNQTSLTVESRYFQGSDRLNWSAFTNLAIGKLQVTGQRAEFGVHLDTDLVPGQFRAKFASASTGSDGKVCAPIIDGLNGAIVIRQTPLDVGGIVSSSDVMTLDIRATGKDVTLESIAMQGAGALSPTVNGLATPLTIRDGSSATLAVRQDLAGVSAGPLVKAAVASVYSDGSASTIGNELSAYVISPPANIAIDGAFADWNGVQKISDPSGDSSNPSLDIVESAGTSGAGSLYAFVKFASGAQSLGGTVAPMVRVRSAPSPPSNVTPTPPPTNVTPAPVIIPRLTGEDVTRIYIDSVAGGGSIGGIDADYCLEIKGYGRKVTTSRLLAYPGMTLAASAIAATGGSCAEAGVALSAIGSPAGPVGLYIETTDWQGTADESSTSLAQACIRTTRYEMPGECKPDVVDPPTPDANPFVSLSVINPSDTWDTDSTSTTDEGTMGNLAFYTPALDQSGVGRYDIQYYDFILDTPLGLPYCDGTYNNYWNVADQMSGGSTSAECIIIHETINGVNGWTDRSQIGSTNIVLTTGDDFAPSIVLEPIPNMAISSQNNGTRTVTLTWTGLNELYRDEWFSDLSEDWQSTCSNVVNYTLYRSTDDIAFTRVGFSTAQSKGGPVTATDTVAAAGTYYYRLAVNFRYPNNNGANKQHQPSGQLYDWLTAASITPSASTVLSGLYVSHGRSQSIPVTFILTATATGPTSAGTTVLNPTITYTYTGSPSSVEIYYTSNGGTTWILWGTDTGVDGSWTPSSNLPGIGTYYWNARSISSISEPVPSGAASIEAGPYVVNALPEFPTIALPIAMVFIAMMVGKYRWKRKGVNPWSQTDC